jgi:hypothetical protein
MSNCRSIQYTFSVLALLMSVMCHNHPFLNIADSIPPWQPPCSELCLCFVDTKVAKLLSIGVGFQRALRVSYIDFACLGESTMHIDSSSVTTVIMRLTECWCSQDL